MEILDIQAYFLNNINYIYGTTIQLVDQETGTPFASI